MARPASDLQTSIAGSAKPIVLSIIGSGRSGSTLLDVALGSHPMVEGVGALQRLPRSGWVRDENRRCSCGAQIDRCPFWTSVLRAWTADVGEDAVERYIGLQDHFERSSRLWPRLLIEERRPSQGIETYGAVTASLYRAIAAVGGRPIVLDSSKKPIRTFALIASDRLDVRVIHLVRDGRGVVWSRLKALERNVAGGIPSDRSSTPPWRTTLHWAQANIESEMVARHNAGKSVRVTYESLVTDPVAAFGRIAPLVGTDLSQLGQALVTGSPLSPGHRVAGNRMRMAGNVRLRPDLEWTEKLPEGDARTFWLMAGWLARRYGYTR